MKIETLPLTHSSPGNQQQLTVFRLGADDPNLPLVYIQAGLHADEWPGMLVIQHLLPMLEQLEIAGKLKARFCVVPYANPVGLNQHTFGYTLGRFDLTNGQNYNRNMPLDLEGLANAVESQLGSDANRNVRLIREALQDQLFAQPDFANTQALHKQLLSLSITSELVLDLHCDQQALPHLYCSDKHQDIATQLADCLDFPILLIEDVLGDLAYDSTHTKPWVYLQNRYPDLPIPLPCFAVTVELRGKYDVQDNIATQDARNLIRFLATQGYVADAIKAADKPITPITVSRVEQVDVVHSPATGLVQYLVPLGAKVSEGQAIAELVLIDSHEPNSRIPIQSKTNGLLFTQADQPMVRPGSVLAMIAGKQALRRPGKQLHA